MELELERFERKLEAGAQFAMTQILFDLAYLDAFLAHFGGRSPIPLLVGVWPMPSLQLAVRIHNEVPGIVVPEPVQERLRAAGAEAARGRPRARARADRGVAREGRRGLRGRAVPAAARDPRRPLARRRGRWRPRSPTPGERSADERRSGRRSRRPSRCARRRSSSARGPGRRRPGPPELPCRTTPAQRRDSRENGPRPYASSVRNVAGLADPAGRRGERAVLGIAEDRDGLSLDRDRRGASGRAPSPATRRTATSLRGSKATTSASRNSPSLRSTRASFIPATTCAFVTTRFGAATQPEPSTPSPHAVPVTRKTLGSRSRTPGLFEQRGIGRRRHSATGPRSPRTGRRARSRRAGARAGTRALSSPRIRERWTSSRSSRLAGQVERDGAGDPHERRAGGGAEHEPAGRVEHAQRRHARRGSTGSRCRPSRPALWSRKPSTTAPPSATSGVYADSLPERNCGASLAPRYAPATIPASERAPPTRPRRSPFSAARAITAAAIQSTVVTLPPY